MSSRWTPQVQNSSVYVYSADGSGQVYGGHGAGEQQQLGGEARVVLGLVREARGLEVLATHQHVRAERVWHVVVEHELQPLSAGLLVLWEVVQGPLALQATRDRAADVLLPARHLNKKKK